MRAGGASGLVELERTRPADVTIRHVNSVTRLWLNSENFSENKSRVDKIKYYFVCFSSSLGSQSDPRVVSTDGMGHRSEFSR